MHLVILAASPLIVSKVIHSPQVNSLKQKILHIFIGLWTYRNSHPFNVHRFKNISSCRDDFSILPPVQLDVKYVTSHSALRERPSLLSQQGSARASAHPSITFPLTFFTCKEGSNPDNPISQAAAATVLSPYLHRDYSSVSCPKK